jgi:hypothetical protein
MEPPPTQPFISSAKNTGPSNTESTGGPQVQAAPLFTLSQYVIPDARAWPLANRLN